MPQFKHYPHRPPALTPEFVQSEFAQVLDLLPAAEAAASAEAWLVAIDRWNALRSYVDSERARNNYALSKNCLDPQLEEAERYLREKILPVHEEGESRFLQALAATRHREGIAACHGNYFLDRMAAGQDAVAPINSELRVRAGELATQYDKQIASAEVRVGGEAMTLTKAVGIAQGSEDSAQRREAFVAQRQWFLDNRESLAALFGELVGLRDRMGRNLGHSNFVPLGYAIMSRTDYGPA
ncbi:MAG: hypothetical protein ABIV63_19510, partial [Caldimonas sp.]